MPFSPLSDNGHMDSVRGTNIASALVEIAARTIAENSRLEAARTATVLDAMREGGALLVSMLEGLGENIDTYA